ncbi:helix-turn-helix domain-containing protein [Enterococcus faecalis]|uniref:helix-turn-helix domain-containing protein n=1 Tax=Enterococcus faecalis TaxID=1351 RepID=UPI000352EA47|nr:helix-turn-helix domain-containing protein [Enterococcus faecalis]EGO7731690.1 helix-turn-helix domain-containing protein [Enterococcus faecalis]EHH1619085.1 helix-turn-helix domain-containing protein [Enterococcus faecalis]EHQ2709971.1 helix-turn-helix domain-containing protein [Enterococcus faecalis]EIQ7136781.1 helix-turn-helix domain-containing protein [Enterococcus faecalis]EIY9790547.1 helix-turn-helix domain-containing protein [Enterococcus faecalis]
MNEMKILLSDEQLQLIQKQLNELITNEIEKIKSQTSLPHRYMNKKQTCDYLQISNNTLDLWIRKGLPKIKINGAIRFDRIAIDNWLSELAKPS